MDIVSVDGLERAGHSGEDDVAGLVLIPWVDQAGEALSSATVSRPAASALMLLR